MRAAVTERGLDDDSDDDRRRHRRANNYPRPRRRTAALFLDLRNIAISDGVGRARFGVREGEGIISSFTDRAFQFGVVL